MYVKWEERLNRMGTAAVLVEASRWNRARLPLQRDSLTEFPELYQSKRSARAFANEEIEHQALLCSLELNILAENHAQLHLMDSQMKRTQDDLHELERMLAGIEEARYRCAG